ncbi:MAG: transglycosylase family protein [Jatrophihabitantaceae bacterium]
MTPRFVRSRPFRRAAGATAAAGTMLATAGVIAGPAQAAPAPLDAGSVWDHVASCESSGRWHVDTHNHFYGGLQFWHPTWDDFGGTKYAPRADLATERQQIEVARRVLATQGPRAWPVCGKRAKLTVKSGAATQAALPNVGPYLRSVPVHTAPRPAHHKPRTPRVQRYRVTSGDSLSTIAQHFGVTGGWQSLWQYNRTNVPNPNVILIGQLLQIP